jgi:hypothetical protein
MKLLSPVLSLFLIPLLVILPLQAQLPAPDPAGSALRVLLKSQTAAVANSQAAAGFVVEVTDAKGAPVRDAAVAFRLPDAGVTGTFADGLHAAVVYTDAAGQAHSPAVHWGAEPGSASLRITAVKGPLHAGLLLEEAVQLEANPATSSAPPISTPQVVVVSVPSAPVLQAPVPIPPTSDPPLLSPLAPAMAKPAVSKPLAVANSGASPAPVPVPVPVVSITNTPNTRVRSNKKWMILAVIAVGAGVGVALAMKGKGTTTTAPAAPPIGAPTVSIGGSH